MSAAISEMWPPTPERCLVTALADGLAERLSGVLHGAGVDPVAVEAALEDVHAVIVRAYEDVHAVIVRAYEAGRASR